MKLKVPFFFSGKFLKDNRGYLHKFTDKKILKELKFKIIETQVSQYKKNVFRGIYMQLGNFGEAKLIKLLKGDLTWFAVDLRRRSDTFKKIYKYKLSKKKILFTPRGFAHGSFAHADSEVLIIADNQYNNKHSIGINYKDKDFYPKIKKIIKINNPIISNWHKSFRYFDDIKNKI